MLRCSATSHSIAFPSACPVTTNGAPASTQPAASQRLSQCPGTLLNRDFRELGFELSGLLGCERPCWRVDPSEKKARIAMQVTGGVVNEPSVRPVRLLQNRMHSRPVVSECTRCCEWFQSARDAGVVSRLQKGTR